MKVAPIRRRFSSGSTTPSSASRNWVVASTWTRLMWRWVRMTSMTRSPSPRRSSPLSTKTQVSWSPTARCTSVAATAELTPPLSAQITLPSPICRRKAPIVISMNDDASQVPAQPHTSKRKFRRMSRPSGVCATSGWNWMPYRLPGPTNAAQAELRVCAMGRKPGGSVVTTSPCDIQTASSGGSFAKRPTGSSTVTDACPYSRRSAGATPPPRSTASRSIP